MNELLETALDILFYAGLAYCLYHFAEWFLAKINPDWGLKQLAKRADKLYLGISGRWEKGLKEFEEKYIHNEPDPEDVPRIWENLEHRKKMAEEQREKISDLLGLKYVYDKSMEVFKFEPIEKRIQIVQDWYDYLLKDQKIYEVGRTTMHDYSDKASRRYMSVCNETQVRGEIIRKRMLDRLGLEALPTYKEKKALEESR